MIKRSKLTLLLLFAISFVEVNRAFIFDASAGNCQNKLKIYFGSDFHWGTKAIEHPMYKNNELRQIHIQQAKDVLLPIVDANLIKNTKVIVEDIQDSSNIEDPELKRKYETLIEKNNESDYSSVLHYIRILGQESGFNVQNVETRQVGNLYIQNLVKIREIFKEFSKEFFNNIKLIEGFKQNTDNKFLKIYYQSLLIIAKNIFAKQNQIDLELLQTEIYRISLKFIEARIINEIDEALRNIDKTDGNQIKVLVIVAGSEHIKNVKQIVNQSLKCDLIDLKMPQSHLSPLNIEQALNDLSIKDGKEKLD